MSWLDRFRKKPEAAPGPALDPGPEPIATPTPNRVRPRIGSEQHNERHFERSRRLREWMLRKVMLRKVTTEPGSRWCDTPLADFVEAVAAIAGCPHFRTTAAMPSWEAARRILRWVFIKTFERDPLPGEDMAATLREFYVDLAPEHALRWAGECAMRLDELCDRERHAVVAGRQDDDYLALYKARHRERKARRDILEGRIGGAPPEIEPVHETIAGQKVQVGVRPVMSEAQKAHYEAFRRRRVELMGG